MELMMKTLSSEIRRHLGRTMVEARDVTEAGVRAALEAFAVHHHEAYEHMSGEQRALRRRLRVHARQLGDRRDARSGQQAVDHLVHECAYEHWHAMLLTRFLAENHLLIEPELGIAITLQESRNPRCPASLPALRAIRRYPGAELFASVLEQERTSDEQTERAVTAQGMAPAAELLAGRYHWMITNVPYLARGKQAEKLRAFCEQHYPAAENDLATVFLERCLELCVEGGTASLVLPQNWLFLVRYKKLLKIEAWHVLARLGEGGFDSLAAAGAFVALLTLTRGTPTDYPSGLFSEAMAANTMYGLDVSESRTVGEKAARLLEAETRGIEQVQQLENPDARVAVDTNEGAPQLFVNYSTSLQGLSPADAPRYGRTFWELSAVWDEWCYWQSTVEGTRDFGGKELILQFGADLKQAVTSGKAYLRGVEAWGKQGVVVRQMRTLPCSLYSGDEFDTNCAVVVPTNHSHLPAIWCFCSSPECNEAARCIDPKLNVTNATLVKVPFDLDRWTRERYPHGLPLPYSNDLTQWIFHGHPCGSVVWDEIEKRTTHGPLRTGSTVLQVAVARLLGYRWPAGRDTDMEPADEQQEWGRRGEALPNHADEDGIICISPIRGEPSVADRLLGLLAAAFDEAWGDAVLTKLLAEGGSPSLDDWLRNRFFDQHCQLFHNRPFIWHLWDGRRRDGFHALVNYHKLAEGNGKGRRCRESLTYSYLGDWITRQQDGVRRGEDGADDRLVAALALQKRLAAILEGEPPFDIFIRWKPIEEQPIGWEPDINDGVCLNSCPFMADDVPGGRKGADILRTKPNVHWRKDRGKKPSRDQRQFPWFWKNEKFTGERVSDVHLSIERKRTARERAGVQL